MPVSRSGHRTTLRRDFPCNHSDITSTVGRPMAPRRRGWWARRLSGRGIGRVLSSPPSDGRHGVTGWPTTSALSVRIAGTTTGGHGRHRPEPALQRWPVRRVKAHTSAAGLRCSHTLAGTDDPGTEGLATAVVAESPGLRGTRRRACLAGGRRWRSMCLPIRRRGGNQTRRSPRTPYVHEAYARRRWTFHGRRTRWWRRAPAACLISAQLPDWSMSAARWPRGPVHGTAPPQYRVHGWPPGARACS
jgi:hypothetical protein